MTPAELTDVISEAAADKKAREIVTLDLRGKTTVADFFVVCEGDTDRQVRAIVDNIEAQCRDSGIRPIHVSGLRDASWACLDYDAVVVHVFLPGERTFYDLEGFWNSMMPGGGSSEHPLDGDPAEG